MQEYRKRLNPERSLRIACDIKKHMPESNSLSIPVKFTKISYY